MKVRCTARCAPGMYVVSLMAGYLGLSGCGYSSLQAQDESVKTAWSRVVTEYRRRAELIPNLLDVVQTTSAAVQPRLIQGVAQARETANSAGVAMTDALTDPTAFARLQAAQSQLSSSLDDLLAQAQSTPQLRGDTNFQELRRQLGGVQTGIQAATARYMDVVRGYNTTVRSFPTNLTARICDFAEKPSINVAATPQ